MKYYITLIILLSATLNFQGQTIKNMVPNNPGFIMKLNGNALENNMPMAYLDKLPVFQELLNEFYSWEQRDQLKTMEDFGIDFKKSTYMFFESTDSIPMFYMIYPISDVSKLERMEGFNFSPEDIKRRSYADGSMAITWTDNHLVFVAGEINKSFIRQDSTFKSRYGFGSSPYDYGYNDNYNDSYGYNAGQPSDQVEVYSEDGNSYYEEIEVTEDIAEAVEGAVEAEPEYTIESTDIVEDSYPENDVVVTEEYQDPYETYYHLKDSVTGAWLLSHAKKTLSRKNTSHNKRVSDVFNSNSEASFYASYGDLMGQYLNMLDADVMDLMGYYSGMSSMMNLYSGIELTGDVKFEDEEVKLYTEFISDSKNADLYSKMSDNKFNKKMLKHMALKNVLGYYSLSVNSKAILDFYPQFISTFVGMQPYMEGMGPAIADIFEVMLDEQAIADIMPGNLVLLCDGFTKQKMNFTSYDYDENFNRVEVTREVEENLPSFLMMIESKNFKTIKYWLDFAVRESNGLMIKTDYGYVVNASNDLPVMMHVIFKNGIVYLCNDTNKMNNIVSGIATGSSNKEHKKLLSKNNTAVYFDAQKLMDVIPFPAYSEKDEQAWELMKTKFQDLKIKQYQKDKNTIVSEMILSGPDGMGNSWVSFWETLNEIYEIQTRE